MDRIFNKSRKWDGKSGSNEKYKIKRSIRKIRRYKWRWSNKNKSRNYEKTNIRWKK